MDIRFEYPPDEENIELLFPASGEEIDIGATIRFDEIAGTLPLSRTSGNLPMERVSGSLPVNRITGFDSIMTADEAHALWNET